jgi:hypothetical protein
LRFEISHFKVIVAFIGDALISSIDIFDLNNFSVLAVTFAVVILYYLIINYILNFQKIELKYDLFCKSKETKTREVLFAYLL